MTDTKLTGHLPNMTVEITHRAEPDGSAEHMTIHLTATPGFDAALPMLAQLPLAAAPWAAWAQMWMAPWTALFQANPLLQSGQMAQLLGKTDK